MHRDPTVCVHTPPCMYVPHSIYTKPPIFVHTPLRTCLAHCSPAYPIVRMYTPLCVCILHCLPVYPTVCVYSPPCVPACFVYPNCHLFTACINPILEASSASTGTWTRGLMRRLGSPNLAHHCYVPPAVVLTPSTKQCRSFIHVP